MYKNFVQLIIKLLFVIIKILLTLHKLHLNRLNKII